MKKKNLIILLFAVGLFTLTSCNKKALFVQPSIEVTGVSLKELPQDSVHLLIDLKIKNNDTREADILDASYQATIEGIVSGKQHVQLNKTIQTDSPLVVTLPLTLLTSDAILLLKKLNKGESLDYTVTGTFHVNQKHLNNFDLPLDVTGTTSVKVGYDDFFKQPEVTVDSIHGTYIISGTFPSYTYTFNLKADCSIKNVDNRSAVIDEIKYVTTVEGVQSDQELYSQAYPGTTFDINAGETKRLILPVKLVLNNTQGLQLAQGLSDGYADYIIKGTFHTEKVDGVSNVFELPLYEKGKVPVTSIVQE